MTGHTGQGRPEAGVRSHDVHCHDAEQLLDLYIDGELEAAECRELERHLGRCASCALKEERRRGTRSSLRGLATATLASDQFRGRLEAMIADNRVRFEHDEATAVAAAPVARPATGPLRALSPVTGPIVVSLPAAPPRGLWLAAAAVLVGALSLAVWTTGDRSGGAGEGTGDVVAGISSLSSPVVAESVAWHRRPVPVEVSGPSADDVRTWFSDKVSFAVRVPEFERDALLLGGRLSHVRHHEAAYLMYEVDGTKLSVMLFNADDLTLPGLSDGGTFVDNSDGYTVAIRRVGAVTYTFTSDLDERRLLELVNASSLR